MQGQNLDLSTPAAIRFSARLRLVWCPIFGRALPPTGHLPEGCRRLYGSLLQVFRYLSLPLNTTTPQTIHFGIVTNWGIRVRASRVLECGSCTYRLLRSDKTAQTNYSPPKGGSWSNRTPSIKSSVLSRSFGQHFSPTIWERGQGRPAQRGVHRRPLTPIPDRHACERDEAWSFFPGFVLGGFLLARPDQGLPLENLAVGRSH